MFWIFHIKYDSFYRKAHKCTTHFLSHIEIIPSSLPSQIKHSSWWEISPSFPLLLDVQLIVYFFLRNRKLVHLKNPQLFVSAMICIQEFTPSRNLKQIAGSFWCYFFLVNYVNQLLFLMTVDGSAHRVRVSKKVNDETVDSRLIINPS